MKLPDDIIKKIEETAGLDTKVLSRPAIELAIFKRMAASSIMDPTLYLNQLSL